MPRSRLLPRNLEKVSLSPHPLHCLLYRKALWHRSAQPLVSHRPLLTRSKASFSPRRLSTSYKMPSIVSRILKSSNIQTLAAGQGSLCKCSLLSDFLRITHDPNSLSSLLVIFFIECMYSYPELHCVHRVTFAALRHFNGLCGQPPLVPLRTLYPKDQA